MSNQDQTDKLSDKQDPTMDSDTNESDAHGFNRRSFLAAGAAGAAGIEAEHELDLDGKKLFYVEAGEKSEPAIVLLHGARYSSKNWRDLGTLERLAAKGYFVVALDLPGFGRSQTSEIERDELLGRILDGLGIERAVLVSPSMSGQFSFPLVTRNPERVAGFVTGMFDWSY